MSGYQMFGSVRTIDWLADNDRDLLEEIVTHNEKVDKFCL